MMLPSDSNAWIYTRLKEGETVYQFYKEHRFNTVWLKDGASAMADSMFLFLKNVRLYGLLPQDYHITEIENLEASPKGIITFYRKDALLTDAFLSLAMDLKYGRLDSNLKPNKVDSLTLQILDFALVSQEIKKTLESQEPSYPEYQFLKKSLHEMLNSTDSTDRNMLFSGVTYDSIILHKKVQYIEINMERWRNEVVPLENRYIWINIPSYQLQVVDKGQTILESRIIVGKPETRSPVLSSLVECITLYPYWHVPRKIAIEEFLPVIQSDTSFLTLNKFDVLDRKGTVLDPDSLDWKKYNKNYFPFSLRQREGKENSLGLIKFVFDNPYAVFLHDTNAKGLFSKKTRALSHGCIRMEKAVELVKYLVPAPDKIDQQLDEKERRTINLSNPIPIHIRYLTCEHTGGVLIFFDDIYQQDQNIIQLLYHHSEVAVY